VIGQGVSLFVGITMLPTIYYLLYRNGKAGLLTRFVRKVSLKHIEDKYEKGMNFFFRYRTPTMISFGLIILVMVWFFITMEKEKFPAVRQDELVISLDWNENITLDENLKRIREMIETNSSLVVQTNSFIGEQQFLFNRDYDQSYTQAKIYIKAEDYASTAAIEKNCYEYIRDNYPGALVSIGAQQNIFEKIFEASEEQLVAEVSLMKEKEVPPVDQMTGIVGEMRKRWPDAGISMPPLEDKIRLKIDPDRLLLYDVEPTTLYNTLKASLNQYNIGELRASYELLPIVLSDREKQISDIVSSGFVLNTGRQSIPVKELVNVQRAHDYKTIKGGMNGEYVPVSLNIHTNKPAEITSEIRNIVMADPNLSASFSGALISGQRLFKEL